MGLFDALKSAAGNFAEGEEHQAFGDVLAKSPIGGMSGLLDKLQQGGLDEQVSAWRQGDHSGVTPELIKDALGEEHVQHLANSLGISTDEVADQLAQHLPAMAQAHAEDQAAAGADQSSGNAEDQSEDEDESESADAN